MKFSITRQKMVTFKYKWLLNRGDRMCRFVCIFYELPLTHGTMWIRCYFGRIQIQYTFDCTNHLSFQTYTWVSCLLPVRFIPVKVNKLIKYIRYDSIHIHTKETTTTYWTGVFKSHEFVKRCVNNTSKHFGCVYIYYK
jgi:hypothetical protein